MLIFLHQKYEIELRNLFRIFEKNRNRKRSIYEVTHFKYVQSGTSVADNPNVVPHRFSKWIPLGDFPQGDLDQV